jgi:hypothetical protein
VTDYDPGPDELVPARVKCIACDRRLSEDESGPACADCESTWKCWACDAPMSNRQIAAAMKAKGAGAEIDCSRLLCEECREVE